MNIEILDAETIDVFGATPEQAWENHLALHKFIGNDRWRRSSGKLMGKPTKGDDWRWKVSVNFKSANERGEPHGK
jgi:hypothetical protein